MLRSTDHRRGHWFATGVALVTAAVVVRGLARRRPAVQAVATDLRHPVLHLPTELRGERSLRVGRQLMGRMTSRVVPGVRCDERRVPGLDGAPDVRVLVYETEGRARPSGALLWIHGGGMVMGRPEQDHEVCSRWASELGIVVVSVDYRLAPEDPFPAGLDDCMAALAWLHASADDLGIDVARLAVGGASAGGGLAAAVCQRARDEGGPAIALQVLNYPMLDDRTVLRDDHAGTGAFVWTPTSNRYGWSAYLGAHPTHDDGHPHAAPARATDLSGLPPAWIGVGELDLFHAEDVDYAERLEAAGVPVTLRVEDGMYHGADLLVGKAPRMRAYRASMDDALRDALCQPGVAVTDPA